MGLFLPPALQLVSKSLVVIICLNYLTYLTCINLCGIPLVFSDGFEIYFLAD